MFRVHVIFAPDNAPPITTVGSTTYFHVRHNDLWIMAASRFDANPALVFELLFRIISVGESLLGGQITEALVRRQDIFLYELLDEMVDFGYPQTSDVTSLKMLVNQDRRDVGLPLSSLMSQVTGQTSWRPADVKHSKNECYLDVIESLNVVVDSAGDTRRATVDGKIMMKAFLSGMPECQVGLNNELRPDHVAGEQTPGASLSDCNFHQCVRLDAYERMGEISFIPPNGEFELMSYNTTQGVHVPLVVRVSTYDRSGALIPTIRLCTHTPSEFHVSDIVVWIPAPSSANKARCNASTGKARYEARENAIAWRIPRLSGGSEASITTDGNVPWPPSTPLVVDFSVLMYCASGIVVRYLKVTEQSGYRTVKWVRYLTRASGSYIVRA